MDSDDTFKTPQPRATSTMVKQRKKRGCLNAGDCVVSCASNNLELMKNKKRQEQYELSENLLKKASQLPSFYLQKNFGTPSLINDLQSESTVNESDLMKPFVPSDVSTPRASYSLDIAANLSQLKHQLEYSDVSLRDLCGEFSKIGSSLNVENESFASGELAFEKIAQQEQSWLKERGILGTASIQGDSIFAQLENCNMTDFFKKRSELSDVFLKCSPEKDILPAPLVVAQDKRQSTLSSTAFENINTTAQIFDLLCKPNNKENKIPEKDIVMCRPSSTLNILCDSSNVCDKSLSSVRTVSSLDHLSSGKLPIETNRTELVWGCTQVGKNSSEHFILRNKSSKKINLKVTSSNICFRIYTDQGDSEAVTSLPVLLYPAESRCFKVVFTPTAMGAFVERLCFVPISEDLKYQQTKRQTLMLYGYGGNAHVDIINVAKDSNMKMWLSLGKLDNHNDITQKFTVRNTGTLPAFVWFSLTCKVLFGDSRINITPMGLIVTPKSQESVTVTFTPSPADLKHMLLTSSSQVIEIGSIQIISGAESLRGRIKNIGQKILQGGGEIPDQLFAALIQTFHNEKIPSDIRKFTETARSLKYLMQSLIRSEITLTVERDPDSTMLGQVVGIDETSFESLTEGMITMVANKDGIFGSCTVDPMNLVLTPPIKMSDQVLLISNHNSPIHYHLSVSESTLHVSPVAGILKPNDTVVIKISCNMVKLKQCQQKNQQLQVSIFADNDVFDVNIKIIFLRATNIV